MSACKQLHPCMRELVFLQATWCWESPVTEGTSKRFLSWLIKCLATLGTDKLLLSCVNELMCLEETWPRKWLATIGAYKLVRFFRGELVCIQVTWLRENLVTRVAWKLLFPSHVKELVSLNSVNLIQRKPWHTNWRKNFFFLSLFLWESLCLFRLLESEKVLLHWSQAKCFSPVWESLCMFKPLMNIESCRTGRRKTAWALQASCLLSLFRLPKKNRKSCHTGCRQTVSLLCGKACASSCYLIVRMPCCTGGRKMASFLCGKVVSLQFAQIKSEKTL